MSKTNNIITFAVGAIIGSAATWYLLKQKFEKQYQEEIRAVKNSLLKTTNSRPEDLDEESKRTEEINKKYNELIKKYDYTKVTQNKEEALADPEEEDEKMGEPYIISPEEYSESEYDTVSLTCYADGIVADTITGEVLENPEDIVGDFRPHFGEYEEDSVFVRNDEECIDYEILADNRKYSDVACGINK